jgi:uncharacterized protein YqkB
MFYFSNHGKYFLDDSYTNDTNKLFKIVLLTVTNNLYKKILDMLLFPFQIYFLSRYIVKLTMYLDIVYI